MLRVSNVVKWPSQRMGTNRPSRAKAAMDSGDKDTIPESHPTRMDPPSQFTLKAPAAIHQRERVIWGLSFAFAVGEGLRCMNNDSLAPSGFPTPTTWLLVRLVTLNAARAVTRCLPATGLGS